MMDFERDRRPFSTLVIASDREAPAAAQAVEQAGGRVLTTVAWNAAAERIGQVVTPELILAVTAGMEDAAIDRVLARVDAIASALDVPLVVVIEATQIDVVAATVMCRAADLLCDPSAGEIVAALSLRGQLMREAIARDSRVSENEAARLARLNEEVARIAAVLARLSRREAQTAPGQIADRRLGFDVEPVDVEIESSEVRGAIRSRRLRDRFFGSGLFEDPAWDMLLDLFAAELERAHVSVSSLCIAAAVAPTTALRWIAKMTEAGLLEREADPFDRRRAFVRLSDRARDGMRGYVAAVREAGLAIA